LIERLKAAKEGLREYDIAIARATYARNWGDDVQLSPPKFTRSLDDALTLVPDEWTAFEMRSRNRKTIFVVELSRENAEGAEDYVSAKSSTLPLALCIAALKARQSDKPSMPSALDTSSSTTRG
jgi:hypothetical protein